MRASMQLRPGREKQKNQAILHGAKASETSHEEIAKGRDLIEDFKDKRRSMNWVSVPVEQWNCL